MRIATIPQPYSILIILSINRKYLVGYSFIVRSLGQRILKLVGVSHRWQLIIIFSSFRFFTFILFSRSFGTLKLTFYQISVKIGSFYSKIRLIQTRFWAIFRISSGLKIVKRSDNPAAVKLF